LEEVKKSLDFPKFLNCAIIMDMKNKKEEFSEDLPPEDIQIADVVGQFVEWRNGITNCTNDELDAVIEWVQKCQREQGLIYLISMGFISIDVHDGEVDFGLTEKGEVVDQSILDSGIDETIAYLMKTAKETDFSGKLVQDSMTAGVDELEENIDNLEALHGPQSEGTTEKGNNQLWYLNRRKK